MTIFKVRALDIDAIEVEHLRTIVRRQQDAIFAALVWSEEVQRHPASLVSSRLEQLRQILQEALLDTSQRDKRDKT